MPDTSTDSMPSSMPSTPGADAPSGTPMSPAGDTTPLPAPVPADPLLEKLTAVEAKRDALRGAREQRVAADAKAASAAMEAAALKTAEDAAHDALDAAIGEMVAALTALRG